MIQKLTDLIIKPYRPSYDPETHLGPKEFSIDQEHIGNRHDFEVKNRRGLKLQCSLFHRKLESGKTYPLMVFCHGNTGNRTSSYGTVYSMLRIGVNVLTFDFAGCGRSEGEMISLGFYEPYDIEDVLEYSVKKFDFVDPRRIGLWGRCMGAVSSIYYTSRSSLVSILVLDSPFPELSALLHDYIQRVKIIPKWAEDYIYNNLREKVQEQANFDLEAVKAVNVVKNCQIPAFLFHGNQDQIIPISHFKRVYDAYPGPKEYLELETSHNDKRPEFVYEKISEYVKRNFFCTSPYGKFGPSSILTESPQSPVIIRKGYTFLTLDTIKVKECDSADDGMDTINPFEQALSAMDRDETMLIESQIHVCTPRSSKPLKVWFPSKGPLPVVHEYGREDSNELLNQATNKGSHLSYSKPKENKSPLIKLKSVHKEPDSMFEIHDDCEISNELIISGEISNRKCFRTSFVGLATNKAFGSDRNGKQ